MFHREQQRGTDFKHAHGRYSWIPLLNVVHELVDVINLQSQSKSMQVRLVILQKHFYFGLGDAHEATPRGQLLDQDAGLLLHQMRAENDGRHEEEILQDIH